MGIEVNVYHVFKRFNIFLRFTFLTFFSTPLHLQAYGLLV